MALPTELTRTTRAPAINHSIAIAAAIGKALKAAGFDDVETKHTGDGWFVCASRSGIPHRVSVEMEHDFVQRTDPNPYEEPF